VVEERAGGEHGVLVGGAQGADLNAHGLTVSTRSPGLPLAREAAGAPGARPGDGRFRTRGRYSSATVRGTAWTAADRCDGALTTVRRGRVAVRDFKRRKNVSVRAGKSYLARARRARR